MTLRPASANWFELLTSREELGAALDCLAATGSVQLQAHSQAEQRLALPDLRTILADYETLARRYGHYWPRAETCRPGPNHELLEAPAQAIHHGAVEPAVHAGYIPATLAMSVRRRSSAFQKARVPLNLHPDSSRRSVWCFGLQMSSCIHVTCGSSRGLRPSTTYKSGTPAATSRSTSSAPTAPLPPTTMARVAAWIPLTCLKSWRRPVPAR